jgi:hypothetical protein
VVGVALTTGRSRQPVANPATAETAARPARPARTNRDERPEADGLDSCVERFNNIGRTP